MIILLNKEFYNKESVKEALNDFKGICRGKILNNSIEIELKPKEDIKQLKEEFCNYVLGLMKNKTLV
ncbi:MAG: HxsD-like protein [Nanoarchaeota archaeon]|nr:HxsD-like protein [Nanoarchaeota archaeon]